MVRSYQVDRNLGEQARGFDGNTERIDADWWSKVFDMKTSAGEIFPILTKLVKAVLSIFSGPVVEGSFNVMDGIVKMTEHAETLKHTKALLS